MRVPTGWTTEVASGWWSLHYLTHTACGFRTGMAYDLIVDADQVREVVYGHTCGGGGEGT